MRTRTHSLAPILLTIAAVICAVLGSLAIGFNDAEPAPEPHATATLESFQTFEAPLPAADPQKTDDADADVEPEDEEEPVEDLIEIVEPIARIRHE